MVFAVLVALLSSPAAAQTSADRDAGFNAAVSAVQAVVSQGALPKDFGAHPQAVTALAMADAAAQTKSCADAKELEIPFELTLTGGRELDFSYAGCREEGRNDYLPPYTERSYKGQDGYGLTIVTDEGAESSEVLVSKGKDWVGNFGKLANAKLVSGETISAGEIIMMDKAKSPARLRGVPDYPQLKACEAALDQPNGYSKTVFRYGQKPYMGYDAARYGEGSTVVMSLVLLTDSAAYYYSEPCDICADVDMCDLKTHAAKNLLHAHMIDCRDMVSYTKGNVVFDACAPR
jgi:hypothetical protein